MKMIGMLCPRSFNSCWRSNPVMPGMAMSRMRHPVRTRLSEARNSSADEKECVANPNSRNKSGNDSRTDSSSSTIATTGYSPAIFSWKEPITQECGRLGKESIALRYWLCKEQKMKMLLLDHHL